MNRAQATRRVVAAVVAALWLSAVAVSQAGSPETYTIRLKSGRVIEADQVWYSEAKLRYRRGKREEAVKWAEVLSVEEPSSNRRQVSQQSYLRKTPDEAESEARIKQAIERAETHFKQGQLSLADGKREQTRDEFDRAVDSILESGVDVRTNPRLLEYYVLLVDRIYRAEVPPEPSTRGADPVPPKAAGQVGFVEQKFEPSPLDELSRLVLTEKESLDSDSRKVERPCDAEGGRRISVRGLRLGMTVAEVGQRVPGLKVPAADRFGRAKSFTYVKGNKQLSRIPDFKDTNALALEFLDGRLTHVGVIYNNSIKWDSASAFINQVSASLKLKGTWSPYRSSYDSGLETLKSYSCNSFLLVAGFTWVTHSEMPVLRWTDLDAGQRLVRRIGAEAEKKRRLEEERRKAFKP